MRIKDAQVKKTSDGTYYGLRRLISQTRGELVGKIEEMYLGLWEANNKLIDSQLNRLDDEGLIRYG